MLFHLFIFFSHMNWSIHSYSVCKLTGGIPLIDMQDLVRNSAVQVD